MSRAYCDAIDTAFVRQLQDLAARSGNGTALSSTLIEAQREAALAKATASVATPQRPIEGAPEVDDGDELPPDIIAARMKRRGRTNGGGGVATHWSTQPHSALQNVHFAAIREDFGIVVHATNRVDEKANSSSSADASSIVTTAGCPAPVRCFEELIPLGIMPAVVRHVVETMQLALPSPVQMQGVPIALSGFDLLATSETGSGKTLAYVLPAVAHVLRGPQFTSDNVDAGPRAVILVPGKELAAQVFKIVTAFLSLQFDANGTPEGRAVAATIKSCGKLAVLVTSDTHKEALYNELAKGTHIIVATPGRLKSLLDDRYVSLANTTFVAVDEADAMADENMIDDVCDVLRHAHLAKAKGQAGVQTVLFTATLLPAVERVAAMYLRRSYYRVAISPKFENLTQVVVGFPQPSRLFDAASAKTMIFTAKLDVLESFLRTFAEGGSDPSKGSALILAAVEKHKVCGGRLLHDVRVCLHPSSSATKVIIFCNKKETCNQVAAELADRALNDIDRRTHDGPEWAASVSPTTSLLASHAVIHADFSDAQRKSALDLFREGKKQVLITTDVLARGLDVADVKLVVNFDAPAVEASGPRGGGGAVASVTVSREAAAQQAFVQYRHRVGRTARAGAKGVAVTFLTIPVGLLQRAERVAADRYASKGPNKNASRQNEGLSDDDGHEHSSRTGQRDKAMGDDDDDDDEEEDTNSTLDQQPASKAGRFEDETGAGVRPMPPSNDWLLLHPMLEAIGQSIARGVAGIVPDDRNGQVRVPKELLALGTGQVVSSNGVLKSFAGVGGRQRDADA